MNQSKLDVLQLRLSRWGQIAGITGDRAGAQRYLDAPHEAVAKDGYKSRIKDILETIGDTLERAHREAGRDDPSIDANSRQILDADLHLSRGMNRIRQRLRASLRKRETQLMKVTDSVN